MGVLQETENARTKADRASRIVDILGFNHDPTRSPEDMLSRTNLLSELSVRAPSFLCLWLKFTPKKAT